MATQADLDAAVADARAALGNAQAAQAAARNAILAAPELRGIMPKAQLVANIQ